MPPAKMLNKDFLKLLLTEEKSLLQLDQVKYVNVPRYDELSVRKFWPMLREDDTFMKYMPNPTTEN